MSNAFEQNIPDTLIVDRFKGLTFAGCPENFEGNEFAVLLWPGQPKKEAIHERISVQ